MRVVSLFALSALATIASIASAQELDWKKSMRRWDARRQLQRMSIGMASRGQTCK